MWTLFGKCYAINMLYKGFFKIKTTWLLIKLVWHNLKQSTENYVLLEEVMQQSVCSYGNELLTTPVTQQ